jgi:RNase H-fold protein (predicted Holliday junction resolvase)
VTELPPHVEQALADLSAEDFAALVARTRQPEEEVTDPKEKAVRALRRHRGLDRTGKASKDDATAGLLRWARGGD